MNNIVLDLIPLYLIALFLGIKHSLDADHVVAISSVLSRSPTLKRTSSLSFAWSLGHMLTASLITFILFTFKETIFGPILAHFELIVAGMLIIIAFLTLAWEYDIIKFGKHSHGHQHDDGLIHHHNNTHQTTQIPEKDFEHSHLYFLSFRGEHGSMTFIGVIHGLASNDELLLLLTLTLGFSDFVFILIGVVIFTIGVVIGMISYGLGLNYTVKKFRQDSIIHYLNIGLSIIALLYAGYILTGGETLNLIPAISI